ncbi:MAG: PepSY domain-containing protein [Acidobacteria bacterium]|nr:PepSY domain-containing protein [Acidobacteriota bacterium]
MTPNRLRDWRSGLAAVHRYLGIGLCLLFAMWFASGAVMVFRPYPAQTEAQRFACLEPIDIEQVTVHPSLLSRASTHETSALRLTSLTDRAVVHVHGPDGIDSYWADTGDGPIHVDEALARRVVQRCGDGAIEHLQTIADDQWTVHEGFADHRPLHRVRLSDPRATVLYVSSQTGEIVQRTTRATRGWSWAGSVPHWLYATAIRRHWALWDGLVWWLSMAGTIGVATGLVMGVVRWRASARSRVSPYPYQGAMYWHHVSGLGGGAVVLAWMLSGGLSMDHGRWFSTGAPMPEQHLRLAGTTRFAGDPQTVFAELSDTDSVKEIEWLRVAGRPYVTARVGPGRQWTANVDRPGELQAVFDAQMFARVQAVLVSGAGVRDHGVLEQFDTYYYGRDHAPRPLPILRVRYDDPADTWLHIDLTTGRLLERLDASRRSYRIWFNALHSHDFPWMLDRPRLRRTWIVALCVLGCLFSCNGVWIAWKRLRPTQT